MADTTKTKGSDTIPPLTGHDIEDALRRFMLTGEGMAALLASAANDDREVGK